MNELPEQIIVDILSNQMNLEPETAWVFNQNRKIPDGKGLYITVGMVDSPSTVSVSKYELPTTIPQPAPSPDIETLTEIITVQGRQNFQIDIMSRNNEALIRRSEVLAVLASTYSVQKQEENAFRIFRIPTSFVNTSSAEGGSMLNRFSLIIAAHVWYRKETILSQGEIYDSFRTRVDDEKTIGTDQGIIEFTIDENTVI
jgi:hypothetical protein